MEIFVVIETLLIAYLIYELYKIKHELNKLRDYKGDFFKSKQAELLFYLTQLEGKQRNRLLGLRDEHYSNKELAKKWYREMAQYVHPDKGGNEKAFATLRKIYEILVEEDEG